MYRVVLIEDEGTSELTKFRGANAGDCWAFIRNRLAAQYTVLREQAKHFAVVDKAGQQLEPPADVRAIIASATV